MSEKKSKRVSFTFDDRSLTTLENMTQDGFIKKAECTEVTIRLADGTERKILIPSLKSSPKPVA